MTQIRVDSHLPMRRIRSFVKRDGRMTEGQRRAFEELWPQVGLAKEEGVADFDKIFGRKAPRILEIGFGSGQSLLETAKANPESDFIGIETYLPGIGALILGVEIEGLQNLRVYYADAVEVLQQCIPAESLSGIQLFFPDPWPKRKHHKRRLIQPEFIKLVTEKLQKEGVLHLATDWEHYGKQMMQVLSGEHSLKNLAGNLQFAERSKQRPIVTKFEQRGLKCDRVIWELQFARR